MQGQYEIEGTIHAAVRIEQTGCRTAAIER